MHWKRTVKKWCRKYNLVVPLLLTEKELREAIKIDSGDISTAINKYLAKDNDEYYGQTLEIDIEDEGKMVIITMNEDQIHGRRQLRQTMSHEFLHQFIIQKNLYSDKDEEFIERLLEKYDKLPIHKAVEMLLKKE